MWKIIVYIISILFALAQTALMTVYMFYKGMFDKDVFSGKKAPAVTMSKAVAIPRKEESEKDEKENEEFTEEENSPSDDADDEPNETEKSESENTSEKKKKDLTDLVTQKEVEPYSKFASIAIIIVSTLLAFGVSVAVMLNVKENGYYCNYAKLVITYFICSAALLTDFKRHIIPNELILLGLGSRVIIYIVEFFCRTGDMMKSIVINDLIGFGIGFGLLFIVALIVKNSLGFGDVKLYGVVGIMTGTICTYSTLIVSLLTCSVVSIVLLVKRSKTRKSLMCFAPFIYIGYTISLLLGAY